MFQSVKISIFGSNMIRHGTISSHGLMMAYLPRCSMIKTATAAADLSHLYSHHLHTRTNRSRSRNKSRSTGQKYSNSYGNNKHEESMVRLSKRMSELDLCSRREADRLISMQKATSATIPIITVKGIPIEPILGQKVPHDEMDIRLLSVNNAGAASTDINSFKLDNHNDNTNTNTNNKTYRYIDDNSQNNNVNDWNWNERQYDTIILHKPTGYISGQPDKRHGHTPAVRLLTMDNYSHNPETKQNENTYKQSIQKSLQFTSNFYHSNANATPTLANYVPAGRLDLHSSGLLFFTKCGVMAKKLLRNHRKKDDSNNNMLSLSTNHPSNTNKHSILLGKEYIVTMEPIIQNQQKHKHVHAHAHAHTQHHTKDDNSRKMSTRLRQNYKTNDRTFDNSTIPTPNTNLEPFYKGGWRLKRDTVDLLPVLGAKWISYTGQSSHTSSSQTSSSRSTSLSTSSSSSSSLESIMVAAPSKSMRLMIPPLFAVMTMNPVPP
mmetsp:Transcript_4356/g.6110  ORF Transcript_4356/g.6110 Transcript_4356/m.6110 type:complete len:491 (+) Transcript_4356:171-1643(+)